MASRFWSAYHTLRSLRFWLGVVEVSIAASCLMLALAILRHGF